MNTVTEFQIEYHILLFYHSDDKNGKVNLLFEKVTVVRIKGTSHNGNSKSSQHKEFEACLESICG